LELFSPHRISQAPKIRIFMLSAEVGLTEAVTLLLESGVDVDFKDSLVRPIQYNLCRWCVQITFTFVVMHIIILYCMYVI